MVKQTAHDGWDECSSHFGPTLFFNIYSGFNLFVYPSAETGKQGKLKLYWLALWKFDSFLG